jgi:hypothetical protein
MSVHSDRPPTATAVPQGTITPPPWGLGRMEPHPTMAQAHATARQPAHGAWKRAADAVPRHEFLRGGFFRAVADAVPSAWAPVLEGGEG